MLDEFSSEALTGVDIAAIAAYNARKAEPYKLHPELGPSPFEGDIMSASVVLLLSNPGFDQTSTLDDHGFERDGWPLAGLHPEAPEGLHAWWESRLRGLIEEFGAHHVSRRVAALQLTPWASNKFDSALRLPSRERLLRLAGAAADRGAVMIVVRGRRHWEESDSVRRSPNKFNANSPLSSYISPGNLPASGWKRVVSALRHDLPEAPRPSPSQVRGSLHSACTPVRIKHLIDGRAVDSRTCFETLNPATQQVLAEVAAGGEAEIHAAVAAAKAAFPKWAALPAAERAKTMHKLGELITKHVAEISRIETDDTGQTITQTGKQLVPRAADNFHYFAEMCTRVDGHTYPTPTHLNYTLFHPVGVCALISPWNVPFMTGTWKIAPCLAFGNTAVLKMSELSPLSISRFGELATEAGLPPGVLNIVHGTGRDAGEPLCAHPDVRAISFTGSTATGQRIVRSAGLKKFSMELGGKSPFVVFDDADLERALDAAVFMIFSNNGERCTAGSRILLQRSIYADFAAKFAERTRRIAVGDPLDDNTIIGPMISPQHLAKVRSCIELGSKEGATLLCGGLDAPELPQAMRNGNFVRPTVFAGVQNTMRIAQEEIFGPVACLIAFDDEADAIAQANDIAYGLSSYVWSQDIGRAHRVAAAIEAGMCFVNSQNVRDLRQPFGGTKASGTGREGGTWSYEVFLEPKNVCVSLGSHHIPQWGT